MDVDSIKNSSSLVASLSLAICVGLIFDLALRREWFLVLAVVALGLGTVYHYVREQHLIRNIENKIWR